MLHCFAAAIVIVVGLIMNQPLLIPSILRPPRSSPALASQGKTHPSEIDLIHVTRRMRLQSHGSTANHLVKTRSSKTRC